MMWIYNLFLYLFSESCAFNPVVKLTGLANLGLVTKTMILSDAVYLHNLTILFFRWGGGGGRPKKSVHGAGPLQGVHVLSSPVFCCLCYCTFRERRPPLMRLAYYLQIAFRNFSLKVLLVIPTRKNSRSNFNVWKSGAYFLVGLPVFQDRCSSFSIPSLIPVSGFHCCFFFFS